MSSNYALCGAHTQTIECAKKCATKQKATTTTFQPYSVNDRCGICLARSTRMLPDSTIYCIYTCICNSNIGAMVDQLARSRVFLWVCDLGQSMRHCHISYKQSGGNCKNSLIINVINTHHLLHGMNAATPI